MINFENCLWKVLKLFKKTNVNKKSSMRYIGQQNITSKANK